MGDEGLRSAGVSLSPRRPRSPPYRPVGYCIGTRPAARAIEDRRVGVKFNPMVAALGCLGAGEAVVSWKELTASAGAWSRCRWCLLLALWCLHASRSAADNSRGVPGAAAARAAAWHNSSVWKVFITACGLAGLPVSESTTRMYPEARILGEAPPVTSLAWPRSPRNRLPSIPVTKKLT